MPARTACPIRRIVLGIIRLFGLGGLPQHKVQRVLLAVVHGHTLASTQLVQAFARQLAVALELAHGIVHVTIRGAIGQTTLLQAFDQAQHLRHVFGCPRLVRGRLDTQGRDVLVHGLGHLGGQLTNGDAALHRPPDDLVVDVGDVAHVGDRVATGLQPALYHVERHHHAGVTHMTQVIDGHAADIHAHLARHQGHEGLNLTRQAVEHSQAHEIRVIRGPSTPR